MSNKMSTVTKRLLLVAGLACAALGANAQMSGTVYIDQNGTASATVFKNWYSFWRSLQGLSRTDGGPVQVAGLAGPVTVEVLTSNTTAETNFINLPNTIGLSDTTPLTINGNGNELWYSGANAAIRLNGADYVTINKLNIRNSNATPGGIWFTNQADYNTIKDCEIYLSASTSTSSSVYYIAMSTSVTSATSYGSAATGTTGQPGSFNTITGCRMYTQTGAPGPYYAVSLNGNSSNYTSVAQNNTFSGNTIENFYYYGVYSYYPNGVEVMNNDISRKNAISGGSSTMYGVYMYYPYCTGRSSQISGNNIHDLPFEGATTSTTNISTFYGTYVYYAYGNTKNHFIMDGNQYQHVFYLTGSRYVNYIYYPSYIDILNNTIDNIDGTSTSSTSYDWYVYYPTAVRCIGNTCKNSNTNGYLYVFYLYYGTTGAYTWNEFMDNRVLNNTSVNYMYSAYLYYYNGSNSWKVHRNIITGNKVTGSTGYFYFYLYYFNNYEVIGNVVAGNKANSQYHYVYSGLNGSYTAEVRNNTFEADMTNVPTPGSSYVYGYMYLYYHTVRFTGNIFDYKGGGSNYYRYMYMYLSYSTPSNLKEFDYNTYAVNSLFTYPYWYFNGTNYTDWATFSASGVAGPHDNNVEPLWIDKANGDWRAGAWETQNNVPYVPINDLDAMSVQRNVVKHDRGGLETNTDIEAISTNFSVPSVVCAGYTTGTTTMTIQSNYPYDLATGFKVSYSVNDGPKTSAVVNTKLSNGQQTTVTFPTPLVLNDYGTNRIALYVDMPDDNTSNDSFIFTTFVKPAPGGGRLLASTRKTDAFYQPSKANDITVLDQPVYYNSIAPRIYSNGTYNTDWVATAYAKTTGGTMRPSSEVTYTAPAAGKDLEVKFVTSDKNMEDSMIVVYLKVTDLHNGCDTIIQRQVLIYPTVVVKFSFPSVNCDGDNILFENQSTVRSGSMEFLWDFGTGVASDQSETPEPTFSFPTSGTYKVKLLAKTLPYGFPTLDSAFITIRNRPVTTFTHTNACEGSALSFNSTGTTVSATKLWEFGDNQTSGLSSPNHSYSKTGSYIVKLTATENGCSATVAKRVYQFDKPKANWSLISGSCDNEEFSFNNTSTIAAGSYGNFWDFNDGTVSADKLPVHIFQSSGLKNVKLVAISEFGCKDSLVRPVTVKESPKVAFSNTTPCSLTATEFTNETPTVSGTIASFAWSFSDGGNTGAESPSHLFKNIGPNTATLKVSLDNGCKSEITHNLFVGVQPTAAFSAADVCTGHPVIFENKTSWEQGDITYSWDFGNGDVSTERAPVKSYNVNSTTTYNVTLKASIAGGCSDEKTQQVTVNEGPQTCQFKAQPDYASSYYGVKLESTDAQGNATAQSGVVYTWVIEGSGNESGASLSHDFKKDGVYSVTMIARVLATGCECSQTQQVVMNRTGVEELSTVGVTVYPNPNSGQFNVALTESFGDQVSIELSNMSGQVIKSISAANTGMVTVDAGDVSDGVYLVRVRSGKRVSTSRITVRR